MGKTPWLGCETCREQLNLVSVMLRGLLIHSQPTDLQCGQTKWALNYYVWGVFRHLRPPATESRVAKAMRRFSVSDFKVKTVFQKASSGLYRCNLSLMTSVADRMIPVSDRVASFHPGSLYVSERSRVCASAKHRSVPLHTGRSSDSLPNSLHRCGSPHLGALQLLSASVSSQLCPTLDLI